MKYLNNFFIFSIYLIIFYFFECYASRHERFEYKYSFKKPYLAQKDGTVPFWTYDGNAIASEEMIRITPSLKSKKGSIWCKNPTNFEWWEVELWFRITGKGKLGADGLAFFYTTNKLNEGPVFGSTDYWNGLAIFFDSFDNDSKINNPYIMAMVNNGSLSYNHDKDGSDQQLGGCLRDFRNKPYPVRAKIEYYQNTLSLLFHSGNTNNEDNYELCFEKRNVYLPTTGYFGLSAATGELADDHDVLEFLTHSLHEPGKFAISNVDYQEQEKYSKEFESYKLKMDKQKDEYLKEHPNVAPKLQNEPESEYESLGEREFSQILSIQNQLHLSIKNLNAKLDQILGKQERTLSIITNLQGTNYEQLNFAQQNIAVPIQHHIDELISNSRQIKNSIQVMANSQIQQPASVQQASQINSKLIQETRDGVNNLRRELANLNNKFINQSPQASSLNSCDSCLNNFTFFAGILINVAIILAYNIWNNNNRHEYKKFF